MVNGALLILVPKALTRYRLATDHGEFYEKFVLAFLQKQHLDAGTALVQLLKNGKRRVTKKAVRADVERTIVKSELSLKEYLFEFTQDHPQVLAEYRRCAELKDYSVSAEEIAAAQGAVPLTATSELAAGLDRIASGAGDASVYHSAMIGILTAVFDRQLRNPRKEAPLNQGRKRVDIIFNRGGNAGFFADVQLFHKVHCPYVFFECKNYSADPGNPELDQLIGRFSKRRGQLGFLVCRSVDDRELMTARCRDAALHDQGYIIVLADDDVKLLAAMRDRRNYAGIDAFLTERFDSLLL